MCIPPLADRSAASTGTSNKNRRGRCENIKNIINIAAAGRGGAVIAEPRQATDGWSEMMDAKVVIDL